jgi:hypothetical protein
MQVVLERAHRLVFIVIPVIATSAIAPLPGQAATLSLSGASTTIDGFSHTPYSIDTFTDTNTETSVLSGNVQAIAEAGADFALQPVTIGSNFTLTQTNGEGQYYFGIAHSQSDILGRFQINSGEAFSFNFLTALQLEISVDSPEFETTFANGSIQFNLFDNFTGSLLDSFGLVGQLDSLGTNSLDLKSSSSLQQVEFLNPYFSNGAHASSSTQLSGHYTHTFSSPVDITLAESKVNQVEVHAVPEPSSFFLDLGIIAVLALFHKRYRSQNEV